MKKSVFYLIGIIFLMVSCYPGEIDSYDELDLVYTNYDDTYDFASKGTYAMPDKIVKVTGNLAEGQEPEFVQEPYNTEILAMIKGQMSDLGWTEVADKETADMVLLPAVWSNTTVVYWYDYWCWYYYYYCGWGWYYPTYTTYTQGTMVMTLIPNGEASIEPVNVWVAALNGLVSGTYNVSRISNGIDQAFEQSPYLNTK
jgi:hypothetical protein